MSYKDGIALRRERYDSALPYDQWIEAIERELACS